ncbi:MAG: DUF2799 domain-containing protein [Lysobacteraceae bacterium]
MKSHVKLAFAASMLVFALTGCATLSESDCATGDWFRIGRQDALWGHTPDRLAQHEKACTKHGFGSDRQAYDEGFAQGLVEFCVPEKAFDLGRRGNSYYHQCPPEADAWFMPAFDLGRQVYDIDQELIRIESELNDLRKEGKDEKATQESRDAVEQRMRYVKNDRDRRERERDALLSRARERGYSNVW